LFWLKSAWLTVTDEIAIGLKFISPYIKLYASISFVIKKALDKMPQVKQQNPF